MEQPICVDQARAGCGEGLLWDDRAGLIRWVDISGERLHAHDPATGSNSSVAMPCLISALALHQDGGLLIATARGLGRVDADTGKVDILGHPEPGLAGNRLNDMVAGPDGALWLGTMSEGAKAPSGSLYRSAEAGWDRLMSGTTISNGLDVSPDGRRLYFIDSVPGSLHCHEDGAWRIIRSFGDDIGRPDGMCVDRDGNLWVAICDRGQVIGMTPDGKPFDCIQLPCQIVTNCCFGGPDLDRLYITTGTFSMTEAEKSANPLAGGLFALPMPVRGKPPHRVRWTG